MKVPFAIVSVACALLTPACAPQAGPQPEPTAAAGAVMMVNLGPPYDPAFEELRAAFVASNPGYDLEVHYRARRIEPLDAPRVMFLHSGDNATAGIDEEDHSDVEVGDLILLPAGEQLFLSGTPTLLGVTVPEPFPEELPSFVRPEWDPLLVHTPGGCATGKGAYRKLLLTWKPEVGPYVYHGLNAHRVRITDSFSHYHPHEGGFDELYLVQAAYADAEVITSEHVDWIETPGAVTSERVDELLTRRPLRYGDLVYMPRGTMHRGLGGMMVQVISVPGFLPNAEIGLDHHLARINQELELTGEAALPLHAAAAAEAVVK